MRMRKLLMATLFLAAGAPALQAQQNDMDPVTVTASLNPLKASQTGRNLVVIKGEKLASLPVHSLDELLRYVPGVEVQARGPFGSQSDIVLRGGTFQQVLVIVDGVRVNDPNTGHFSSYIPIAPAEIERIEILKGATSALYGSEAVGGVVQVITKTFAARQPAPQLQAAAQLTGGEYGFYGINAGIYATKGHTAFGGGVLSNNTQGQLQRGIRGFVNASTASASVSHRFNNAWQLAFRTAYDHRTFAAQNFYTNYVSDTAQETVQTFWNQLQLTRSHANNTLRVQAGYKQLTDSFAFNAHSATNQNKSSLWQALVSDEIRLSAHSAITTGLQYSYKKILSNDRGNHHLNQAAAFLKLQQQAGENFFIMPAARVEWNERSGWELVPQINLSYHLRQLQLRGSAGKTIRDADFTERYNNYNKALVSSGRIGNPGLTAERSFSYEAGADYFAGSSWKLSGSFFQRRHKNLIDYVSTPYAQMPRKENLSPTGTYLLAQNIEEVLTTGVETDLQFTKNLAPAHSLWATLGFTWLHSSTSNGVPSLYISSHAHYLTNLNLLYNHPRFSIAVNAVYKERPAQKDPSPLIAAVSPHYLVLNTKAELRVKKSFRLFAEATNLFNSQFSDLLGAPMPGRWLMGGIKISLPKQ